MSKKEFTVGQFIDMMEKNGLKKIKGTFLTYRREKDGLDLEAGPIAGCALGQAAWNLNVNPTALSDAINNALGSCFVIHGDTDYKVLPTTYIYTENDSTNKSIKTIARNIRKVLADKLDIVIKV